MIGLPEILILIFIALLVFGGALYKRLPQLGRRAGEGARKLGDAAMQKGDEAKQLAATTKEKHGDKLEPSKLARQAGKGVREAREFRDSFTGAGTGGSPTPTPAPTPSPTAEPAPEPSPAAEPRPDPESPRDAAEAGPGGTGDRPPPG